MIKKIGLIFIFSITYINNANSQIIIYLKEYKIYFTPKKCKDSVTYYLNDSSFLKIDLLSCKGKMNIREFNKAGSLVLSGQYSSSLDTLKEYIDQYNLIGDIIAIKVTKYFQPL